MITIEKLLSFDKEDLQEISRNIHREDLFQLVEWLSEKDDKIRYQALLLLQYRSAYTDDVYPFWDTFYEKLIDSNSYQRSIGLILLAENTKWDKENKFEGIIDEYLLLLKDEKPITIRQCIQALCKVIPYKKHLCLELGDKIMAINISELRETMRKPILIDILNTLAIIRKYDTSDEIEQYILYALTGGVLDKKAIKQVEALL